MKIAGLDVEARPMSAPIDIPVGVSHELLGYPVVWWHPGIVAKIGGQPLTISDARMLAAFCVGACEQVALLRSVHAATEKG